MQSGNGAGRGLIVFKPNKTLGSALLIISAMTGVNITILPAVSANIGFIAATFLLVTIWFLTTITGLLVLEVALNFKEYANGFSSMATETLGRTGKAVVWTCFLLLFYASIAAYISSVAALPGCKIYSMQLPNWSNAIFLILIIGGIIISGTGVVDLCNRGLITIKGLCVLSMVVFLMPKVHLNMMPSGQSLISGGYLYLGMAISFILSAFKFHIIIPSICNYVGYKPLELKRCIIVGSVTALIVSLFFMLILMTTASVVGENIQAEILNNKWLTFGINGFFNIALSTSFLLMSLGLFDFLADAFKRDNSRVGRLQTALLTFLPPLIFGLFYPQGFMWILKYAAFFTAFLIVILPALMAYRMRAKSTVVLPYQVAGGKFLLITIMVAGVVLAVLPFI